MWRTSARRYTAAARLPLLCRLTLTRTHSLLSMTGVKVMTTRLMSAPSLDLMYVVALHSCDFWFMLDQSWLRGYCIIKFLWKHSRQSCSVSCSRKSEGFAWICRCCRCVVQLTERPVVPWAEQPTGTAPILWISATTRWPCHGSSVLARSSWEWGMRGGRRHATTCPAPSTASRPSSLQLPSSIKDSSRSSAPYCELPYSNARARRLICCDLQFPHNIMHSVIRWFQDGYIEA